VDKRTIILVVVLGLLVVFWAPIMTTLGFLKPAPPRAISAPTEDQQTATQTKTDTVLVSAPVQGGVNDSTAKASLLIAQQDSLPHDTIIIETDVWLVTMTNHGGAPVSLKLKKFNYHSNGPVELLPGESRSTPEFLFSGGMVNANDFVYQSSLGKGKYVVDGDPLELSYTFQSDGGGILTKKYRFYKSRYDYDLKIEIANRSKLNFERDYSIEWNVPLKPTELDIQADNTAMWALAFQGKERIKFTDYTNNKYDATFNGTTNWIAARSKYFTTIMIPRSQEGSGAKSAGIKANETTAKGSILTHKVTTGLVMELPGAEMVTDSFTIFAGPIDYDLLKSYDNNVIDIIDIGTTPFVGWIVKIFAIPILWLLPRMHAIIPNYGFVIIIFSLIIKVLTWPLSKKTAQSMAAMKEVQPRLDELKKKHKNNPQALNKEMMKLYKDMGINPFSGCLPYLPQLPLFIALYAVFSATILLRQAPFIFWYDDLSRGALTFTDPYIIMVIIMMGLMFVQQKMTMTDPKNKMLIYIMPLFMGFVFYRASAGLVLYWTCFSLFSFIEQLIVKPKVTLPPESVS
jgi:YidC/Oxa1 family membrane protein insertase